MLMLLRDQITAEMSRRVPDLVVRDVIQLVAVKSERELTDALQQVFFSTITRVRFYFYFLIKNNITK